MGCCLSICTAFACCSSIGGGLSAIGEKDAPKIPYLVVLFLSLFAALFLKVWGGSSIANLGSIYVLSICSSSSCMGSQAVMRICFSLAILFATTTLFSFATLHTGKLFILQFLYYIAICIGMFFVQNQVFVVFASIARYLSGFFLLMQLILLVDFAYAWNESWVAKDSNRYKGGILSISVLMLIASIVFWGLFYVWFGTGTGCDLERFFISFTLVISVGMTLLSISGYIEKGGLLPAAVLVIYGTYLLFSALKNDPATCNTFYAMGNTTSVAQIVLGFALVAMSITYSSWSISSSIASSAARENLVKKSAEIEMQKAAGSDEEKGASAIAAENAYTDEEYAILKKANIFFHVSLLLASCYSAMLLTNWGTQLDSNSTSYTTIGTETMWVNIVTQWVAFGLYTWTLVAPKCFPDREF